MASVARSTIPNDSTDGAYLTVLVLMELEDFRGEAFELISCFNVTRQSTAVLLVAELTT